MRRWNSCTLRDWHFPSRAVRKMHGKYDHPLMEHFFMALRYEQKDQLETESLYAFGGTPKHDLVHGFRLMSKSGAQTAAVYWGNNAEGNDVEVAICDSRLTNEYDIRTIQQWLSMERAKGGHRPCNTHQHGSDWPILGFKFAEALAFFKRCQKTRRGWLSPLELSEIRSFAAHSKTDVSDVAEARVLLSTLRPNRENAVIDLVKRANVSTDKWYVRADGTPVASPRSNPAYCFNWCFGGVPEPLVACLWHDSMRIEHGRIVYPLNLKETIQRLDALSNTAGELPDIRMRARQQSMRAKELNEMLESAYEGGLPIRVIINEGTRREAEHLGKDASEVKLRELDAVPWHVESYDKESGSIMILRGAVPEFEGTASGSVRDDPTLNDTAPSAVVDHRIPDMKLAEHYADQHEAREVEKRKATGEVYIRSGIVRGRVLLRAAGSCELCGRPGFLMSDGRVYLETHHIVPLCEGGDDAENNVVAICPGDHREAHYGERASAIREELKQIIARYQV